VDRKDSDQRSRCRVCRETIQCGAKKCIHCDSFQDWRANLNLSSSVLALIIALVSVTSIAGPAILELFQRDGSRVTFEYQQSIGPEVIYVASNSGRRPGSVGPIYLSFPDPNGRVGIQLQSAQSQYVIMPGEFKAISYRVSLETQREVSRRTKELLSNPSNLPTLLVSTTTQFGQSPSESLHTIRVDCGLGVCWISDG
jgi:hypothetical protein